MPFIGQKRNFLKHYIKVLNENIPGNGAGWTIVDAFGGSGLLSHHAKQTKPAARVIYNDFDNYKARINAIADTNRLRRLLMPLLVGIPKHKQLPPDIKAKVVNLLRHFNGVVDIVSVQSWLLFSGNQVRDLDSLCNAHMYINIRKHDYSNADGYLDGVEVVSESYTTLLPPFLNQPHTLLVLDPPYVRTDQKVYGNDQYFGMIEFLRLMHMVRPPFIFFSSTKSELPAYMNLVISERMDGWERLQNHKMIRIKSRVNKDYRYEDNLVYRF